MGAVIDLWNKLFHKIEPIITFELDEIIYSKKHGHNICVMRMVGKNIFPLMTADEILSSKDAMSGLSNEDLIKITRLDMEIKYKKNTLKIVESDRNGTVLLEDRFKNKIRYSEKLIISSPDIQDKLNGQDAIKIGYKVGIQEGAKLSKDKQIFFKRILHLFKVGIKA